MTSDCMDFGLKLKSLSLFEKDAFPKGQETLPASPGHLNLRRISTIFGIRDGPVSRQSFKDKPL